jgi:hypothetical protein
LEFATWNLGLGIYAINKIPFSQTLMHCVGLFRKRIEMQKNWKFKTGIVLIILSVILFLSLPIIPFLSIDSKTKISISTVVFILAEITFWSGGILLGKELFSKYKSYLNPMNWFKKKTVPEINTNSESNENTV